MHNQRFCPDLNRDWRQGNQWLDTRSWRIGLRMVASNLSDIWRDPHLVIQRQREVFIVLHWWTEGSRKCQAVVKPYCIILLPLASPSTSFRISSPLPSALPTPCVCVLDPAEHLKKRLPSLHLSLPTLSQLRKTHHRPSRPFERAKSNPKRFPN